MKETGIIMSGNHPKLVIDLIKTMTRRIVNIKGVNIHEKKWVEAKYNSKLVCVFINDGIRETWSVGCPYGQVGDRLIIKEAWATEKQYDSLLPRDIPLTAKMFYVSDGVGEWPVNLIIGKLRSPMFMCNWMSRGRLEITDEKVARTQDLTLAEAIAEGYSSIEEANNEYLKLNHLPEESNVWNWVLFHKLIPGEG